MPAGIAAAAERFGSVPLRRAGRARRSRSRATGVEVNRDAGATCARSSRRSRSRRPSRAPATARRARAARGRRRCATRSWPTRIERLAADGAAPFYTGDIGAAVSRLGDRARRDAHARGPRRLRDGRRASRCASRYHGREVLTNPPPSAGGILIAYALALLERGPARPTRAGARRRDGGGAGRAHAGVPRPGSPSRASSSAFMALAARLDDARLGARRRRLGVRGHVHQRRGLGDRRARHRRPRQQHDGRAGPLAARAGSRTRRGGGCRR